MADPSIDINKKIAAARVKAIDAKKRKDSATLGLSAAEADLTAAMKDIDDGYAALKAQMDEGYAAFKTEMATEPAAAKTP